MPRLSRFEEACKVFRAITEAGIFPAGPLPGEMGRVVRHPIDRNRMKGDAGRIAANQGNKTILSFPKGRAPKRVPGEISRYDNPKYPTTHVEVPGEHGSRSVINKIQPGYTHTNSAGKKSWFAHKRFSPDA